MSLSYYIVRNSYQISDLVADGDGENESRIEMAPKSTRWRAELEKILASYALLSCHIGTGASFGQKTIAIKRKMTVNGDEKLLTGM